MGTQTSKTLKPFGSVLGGGTRDRTADLLHAMQALSQLSYTPNGETAEPYCTRPDKPFLLETGGVDGARTRDPRRDRPVF
jgi:hypothetical protein